MEDGVERTEGSREFQATRMSGHLLEDPEGPIRLWSSFFMGRLVVILRASSHAKSSTSREVCIGSRRSSVASV